MIIVTGRTFDIREKLKELGGRWNSIDRHWEIFGASDKEITDLRAIPGIFVEDQRYNPAPWEKPEPQRKPTIVVGDDPTFFNYFATQDPSVFFGFSSLRAFTDYVADLPPIKSENKRRNYPWSTDDEIVEWTGTPDIAVALDLAQNGWTDGLGITDMLTVDAPQAKRRYNSVAGGSVNVGRMLAGDPQHMIRRVQQPHHKNIRMFVETIMWKGIGASIASFRALIVAGMIDLLEREGYRCELIAVTNSNHSSIIRGKAQLAVRIKDANERLSLLDAAFALGHPSFSRRLFMAAEASFDECHIDEFDIGLIDEAFTDDHPCATNEFYIPQLHGYQVLQLTENPMSILDFIQPEGLPITIKPKD